jgi:hypothetical protein
MQRIQLLVVIVIPKRDVGVGFSDSPWSFRGTSAISMRFNAALYSFIATRTTNPQTICATILCKA